MISFNLIWFCFVWLCLVYSVIILLFSFSNSNSLSISLFLIQVFAPMGGFQKVSQAFEQLALESGVEIHYNRNVEEVTKDGISYTIDNDDANDNENENENDDQINFLPADMIIVNADLPYSTKTLVNDGTTTKKTQKKILPRYDWDDKYDFSSGVIAFYWSVNKQCTTLNTHNVFLVSSDRSEMEKSWSAIRYNDPTTSTFDNDNDGDGSNDGSNDGSTKNYPFNFYVHRASCVDESAAPKGCDSLMILVPCCTLKHDKDLAHLHRDESIKGYKKQFDDEFISKVREKVLCRLGALDGLQELDSNIVDEKVDTPATYADYYNLAAGTPFALSHGFGQLSLTRPGQQSINEDNILYVGASTRPGNGVPLVLLGAKQVAKKAMSKIIANTETSTTTSV